MQQKALSLCCNEDFVYVSKVLEDVFVLVVLVLRQILVPQAVCAAHNGERALVPVTDENIGKVHASWRDASNLDRYKYPNQ